MKKLICLVLIMCSTACWAQTGEIKIETQRWQIVKAKYQTTVGGGLFDVDGIFLINTETGKSYEYLNGTPKNGETVRYWMPIYFYDSLLLEEAEDFYDSLLLEEPEELKIETKNDSHLE